MNVKKIVYILSTITMLGILFGMANNSIWKYHSEFDIRTFYIRFTTFSETTSFINFDQNEYLPGSLFFLLSPVIFNKHLNYDAYLTIFIYINLLLITLHLFIYKKISSLLSYLPIILFIALGPILLFRFELFVSAIFLLVLYLFIKNNYFVSGVFMGLAIMIKVYPLIVLPYLLILLFKNGKYVNITKYVVGVTVGIMIPIGMYVYLGGNISDPIKNLTYHLAKPIGVESITASVVSIKSLSTIGHLPHIDVINGIWGIPEPERQLPVDYLPYLAVALFYIILLFILKKGSHFSVRIPMFIILAFLAFSKYLNPQYLFWIFGLLPLVELKKGLRDLLLVTNSILILILTQLTFPIFFTQLLNAFNSGLPNTTFYLLLVRNSLIILELLLLCLSSPSTEDIL